jgi:predicted acyl esterase
VFRSGTLKAAPTGTGHDRFVADPFDTQIIELELGTRAITRPSKPDTSIVYPDPIRGMHFQIAGEDPTDAAFAFNLRGQGVVYHSEPLESDIEIAGLPQLEMWLTLSTPDTDIVALLYEILEEEGQSILLWSNILRLRYRESWQRPKLSVPGEAIRAEFFVPKFMSRRVRRGSRLRLVIRSPASIYYQKNLNTGKPVHEERSEDARRCEVWVHHERDRQTMLKLPVTRGQRAPT